MAPRAGLEPATR